MDRVSIYGWG
ncbi:hypothetical protein AYI68_g2342, partial [Smittium mucronatum]